MPEKSAATERSLAISSHWWAQVGSIGTMRHIEKRTATEVSAETERSAL